MKNINIVELLKDCPQGMELDCTMYEDVYFDYVDELNIIHCYIQQETHKTSIIFSRHGTPNSDVKSKCVIFPKGKTTWEGFQRPFKDGDVVATTDGTWVGITLGGEVGKCIPTYCVIDSKNEFMAYLERKQEWVFSRLATEEEKQKLFDAIKANGYKWNAETKTLEKLIVPKFKVGDRVLWKYDTETPRTILEVKHTTKGGYVYWINCEGCTSRWWDETELIPIPNKFDITTLKPFESRVLTRGGYRGTWKPAEFGFYDETEKVFYAVGGNCWVECIPYDGNEHLLGTTNDCDDYYKTW